MVWKIVFLLLSVLSYLYIFKCQFSKNSKTKIKKETLYKIHSLLFNCLYIGVIGLLVLNFLNLIQKEDIITILLYGTISLTLFGAISLNLYNHKKE